VLGQLGRQLHCRRRRLDDRKWHRHRQVEGCGERRLAGSPFPAPRLSSRCDEAEKGLDVGLDKLLGVPP
jgi:hypothetical protein